MSGSLQTPARAGLALATFFMLCATVIVLLWLGVRTRIEDNRNAERARILHAVLGPTVYDNDLVQSEESLDSTFSGGVKMLRRWRAMADGAVIATVIEAETPNGYSGPIRMLVGVGSDGRVIAVRVSRHGETPGLGDQIDKEKSDWIDQFDTFPAHEGSLPRWRIRQDGGDFDKISGATITSRALVQAIAQTARWHDSR